MSEHEQVMNILVVDENPDNLRLLAEILSEPHYNETLDKVKAFTLGGLIILPNHLRPRRCCPG
jgi:DNA-binding response OmpR family regulator